MKFQPETVFSEALKEYSNGNFSQAREKCQTILEYHPLFGEAYNLLAVIAQRNKQPEQALQLFRLALKTNPGNSKYLHNIGIILERQGKEAEAESHYRKALSLNQNFFPALLSLAKLYRNQKKYSESERTLKELLAIKNDHIPAYNLLGNILVLQGREEEAFQVYQKGLEIHPEVAELHYNLANIYLSRGEEEEAEKKYQKCISLNPSFYLSWNALGNLFLRKGKFSEADKYFRKAIQLKPDSADSWFSLGLNLQQQGAEQEARQYFLKAIQLDPRNPKAHYQLANGYINTGFNEEAKPHLVQAIALKPEFDEAIFALAKIYTQENKYEESRKLYEKLLALSSPHQLIYHAEYFLFCLKYADWNNYDHLLDRLKQYLNEFSETNEHTHVPPPLTLNYLPVDPETHLQVARLYSKKISEKAANLSKDLSFNYNRKKANERIRIGYISPDFRQHAVGLLLNEVFVHHNREKVEVYLYHLVSHEDEYTRKFKSGADVFRNLSSLSYPEAARQIHEDGIDVLIDLAGYTTYSRPLILALKPAPLQIQFMGYPDTTGSDWISHILVDKWLVTEEMGDQYSEKVIRLPNAFFTSSIPVSDKKTDRSSFHLPENAFVFCCFNAAYKISPAVFSAWMSILKQTDNSILWLSQANDQVRNNLISYAVKEGIDPERLRFASKLPMDEYMTSYQCADLFLDTFYYSAGSTAVCALFGGVPVITYAGNTNASRMGASISAAAGLEETIAFSPEEYIQKTVYYAHHSEELKILKDRLVRKEGNLFNTALSINNLEKELEKLVREFSS